MALDIAFYKVTEDIAKRSGLILERYRTKDMHWILDNKDLGRVRFTSDEYIDGLKGVTKITESEANDLIAENDYKMGYEGLYDNENQQQEQPAVGGASEEVEQPEETPAEETPSESPENTDDNTESETIESGDVGSIEDVLGNLTGGNQQENSETEETEQQQNQEEE